MEENVSVNSDGDYVVKSLEGTPPKDVDAQTPEDTTVGDKNTQTPADDHTDESSLTQSDTANTDSTLLDEEQVLKYLSNKQGREINSFEDLIQVKEVEVKTQELDPEIEAIAKWKKETNRSIDDYFKVRELDTSKMTEQQIAESVLRHRHPNLSDAHIQRMLEKVLPSPDGYEDDNERLDKEIALAELVHGGKAELEQLRQNYSVPKQVEPEISQEQLQQIQQETEAALKATTKLTFELAEGVGFDYTIPPESKNTIVDFSNKYEQIVDMNKRLEDLYFVQNREHILKLIYEQGVQAGIAKDDKAARNVTLNQSTPRGVTSDGEGSKIVIEGLENKKNSFKFNL